MRPRPPHRPTAQAFTLLELLVVVAILGILIAILIPSLGRARGSARGAVNLSNLRGMGIGVVMYQQENDGWFFVHEGNYNAPGIFTDDVKDNSGNFSDDKDLVAAGLVPDVATANRSRRAHWVDYIYPYAPNPHLYLSPALSPEELQNFTIDLVAPGAYKHARWGGYGYNFQYLGRAWNSTTGAYRARLNRDVTSPANTLVIGDSAGSRKGATPPGGLMANSYVLDPPLYTINAGAKLGKYYLGLNASTSDADLAATPLGSTDWRYRVFPATRNNDQAGFVFADGHAENKRLREIDDFDGDGRYDNGYWNGKGSADLAYR